MKGVLILLMLAAVAAAAWYLPARPRHHYSETGVVYTTSYLTLQAPTGVVGFPPGTRLRACFDVHVPDEEAVTDGKYTLAVDPQVLTHDIEYAGELAEADQLDQDESQAQIARAKAAHDASQHDVELAHAQDIDGVNASMVAASTVGNYRTHLTDSTRGVGGWGGYASYGYSSGATVVFGSSASTRVTINNYNGTSSSSPARTIYVAKGVPNASAYPLRSLTPTTSATATNPTGPAATLH